jgi:hypothetical protein
MMWAPEATCPGGLGFSGQAVKSGWPRGHAVAVARGEEVAR